MQPLTGDNEQVYAHDLSAQHFDSDGDLVSHNGLIPMSAYDSGQTYPDGTIFSNPDGSQQTYSGGALGVIDPTSVDDDAWGVSGADKISNVTRSGNIGVSSDPAFVPASQIEAETDIATNQTFTVHAWGSSSGTADNGYGVSNTRIWGSDQGSSGNNWADGFGLRLGFNSNPTNLVVSGSMDVNADNTNAYAIKADGDINTQHSSQDMNAGAFNVTSDIRLKKVHGDVKPSEVLQKLRNLRVINYDLMDAYNGEISRKDQVGLIAQEVSKQFPSTTKIKVLDVSENEAFKKGNPFKSRGIKLQSTKDRSKTVDAEISEAEIMLLDYSALVPNLVSAIQELTARIEKLEVSEAK